MCAQAALYGGMGFYLDGLLEEHLGIDLPWWLLALGAIVACTFLGIQGVHSGARVHGPEVDSPRTALLSRPVLAVVTALALAGVTELIPPLSRLRRTSTLTSGLSSWLPHRLGQA